MKDVLNLSGGSFRSGRFALVRTQATMKFPPIALLAGYLLCFNFACASQAKLQTTDNTQSLPKVNNSNAANPECDFASYQPLKNIMAVPVKLIQPKYPQAAKERGAVGRVCVKVLVNPAGHVERACALEENQANKCVSGVDSLLKQAAEAAALASQFNFIPTFAQLNIKSGFVERIVAYNFTGATDAQIDDGKKTDPQATKKKAKRKITRSHS